MNLVKKNKLNCAKISHSGEDEAVLVGGVVARQLVQVEQAHLEHGRVGAEAQVRHHHRRRQLKENHQNNV